MRVVHERMAIGSRTNFKENFEENNTVTREGDVSLSTPLVLGTNLMVISPLTLALSTPLKNLGSICPCAEDIGWSISLVYGKSLDVLTWCILIRILRNHAMCDM